MLSYESDDSTCDGSTATVKVTAAVDAECICCMIDTTVNYACGPGSTPPNEIQVVLSGFSDLYCSGVEGNCTDINGTHILTRLDSGCSYKGNTGFGFCDDGDFVEIHLVDLNEPAAGRPFLKVEPGGSGGGNKFNFDLPAGEDCDQWDNSDAPYSAADSEDFEDCDMSSVTCKLTALP